MTPTEVSALIDEMFDDNEVKETAIYVLSRITLSDLTTAAAQAGKPVVENIPTESLQLMLIYDSDISLNKFYQQNFAVIKVCLANDEAKLNSLKMHYSFGLERNDKDSLKIAKHLFTSRLDTLTAIAFLYKGGEFQREFDFRLRRLLKPSAEFEKMFESYGV